MKCHTYPDASRFASWDFAIAVTSCLSPLRTITFNKKACEYSAAGITSRFSFIKQWTMEILRLDTKTFLSLFGNQCLKIIIPQMSVY